MDKKDNRLHLNHSYMNTKISCFILQDVSNLYNQIEPPLFHCLFSTRQGPQCKDHSTTFTYTWTTLFDRFFDIRC